MSFSQLFFVFCFLPITVIAYYLTKGSALFLLIANLIFYASGAPDFLVLLAILCCATVMISMAIERFGSSGAHRAGQKLLLALGILLNAGILGYYKYFDFFCSQLGISFTRAGSSLTIPLGISFFTFKAISLLVDVYRGKVSIQGRFLDGLTYLSFFAHIQSGPISRFTENGWYNGAPALSWNMLSTGIHRFAIGFSKKLIIADSLLKVANRAFSNNPLTLSTGYVWLGAICYALQLFFDFSGYSDMAIGISNMFGYDCAENFQYPYMTRSISEFWRRWHISLGAWFRDYIYIPLGGSRVKSKLRLFFNLFVVWMLTGLWHGANWTFICWGLCYFVLIAIEKALNLPNRFRNPVVKAAYRIICVVLILFLWVLFRAPSITQALQYIRVMIVPHAAGLSNRRALFLIRDNLAFLASGLILCFPVVPWIEKRLSTHRGLYAAWSVLRAAVTLFAFLWAVSFAVNGSNNPFLYANF